VEERRPVPGPGQPEGLFAAACFGGFEAAQAAKGCRVVSQDGEADRGERKTLEYRNLISDLYCRFLYR
jgi:hypothetical protein